MPLVQPRRTGGWTDARHTPTPTPTHAHTTLDRAWPTELPSADQLPRRQPDAPGTQPVRGWPTRGALGLSAAVTGNPANADGRASVYGIPG
ncbi:hypothetical protein [Streptomyces sp. CBMA29]|uniref:hypothetical protein n=1 Tax=Streptomyces sp. CBMA29 TaxID=1896314 RepID=UPI001661E60B|nr:hypothetical protein [Streptomyces sp. CBMA29]MBD0734036.1 hypothetical protein [Streptomyces sp. CBMA29]